MQVIQRHAQDEDKLEVKPQLEFALKLQDHGSNVTYIKHCDLLLQDLDVELEEDFVNNIVAFINTLPLEEVQYALVYPLSDMTEPV